MAALRYLPRRGSLDKSMHRLPKPDLFSSCIFVGVGLQIMEQRFSIVHQVSNSSSRICNPESICAVKKVQPGGTQILFLSRMPTADDADATDGRTTGCCLPVYSVVHLCFSRSALCTGEIDYHEENTSIRMTSQSFGT